jgi:hypothetical protein
MSVKSPREASSKSGNRCHGEQNVTVSCVLFQCRLAAPEVLRLVHMATTTCPSGTVCSEPLATCGAAAMGCKPENELRRPMSVRPRVRKLYTFHMV